MAVQGKLAAFDAWAGSKLATPVESLGLARLRALSASGVREQIAKLIQEDSALEGEFSQIAGVEKLIRFQKDLGELLTNFVNFTDFYGNARSASGAWVAGAVSGPAGSPPPDDADINNDGRVDVNDLLAIINGWGSCSGCAADLNHNGAVDVTDLLGVINAWD